jgi:hypothetical protein
VPKYPFLRDDWTQAAREIREEYRGRIPSTTPLLRMNMRISDVPFGEGDLVAYMDTTSGELDLDLGSLDKPDLTVGVDYATAKAIFVDQNPQAGMQAFFAGKIKVDGDLSKLMALQAINPDPAASELADRIKDITE